MAGESLAAAVWNERDRHLVVLIGSTEVREEGAMAKVAVATQKTAWDCRWSRPGFRASRDR